MGWYQIVHKLIQMATPAGRLGLASDHDHAKRLRNHHDITKYMTMSGCLVGSAST